MHSTAKGCSQLTATLHSGYTPCPPGLSVCESYDCSWESNDVQDSCGTCVLHFNTLPAICYPLGQCLTDGKV